MTIDVNSEKRSKKIQREVAKRLKKSATFKHALQKSAEKMMEESRMRGPSQRELRSSEEQEAFQNDPEVQEQIKEMLQAHWESWPDHPLPALNGKSPRQASKTAKGRDRLEALLTDFERKSEQQAPHLRPNVKALRRELGLDIDHLQRG